MSWLVLAAAVSATVVIDPGHGGSELGAVGPNGAREKDVALGIGRRVAARLEEAGVRVVLTRESDQTLGLSRRIESAHRLGADAFVSVHMNSSPVKSRRGVETYVAAVLTADEDVARLVEREESGGPPPATSSGSPLGEILDDLRIQSAQRRAAVLAQAIQRELGSLAPLGPDRGLRQAPFLVLRVARVPSVLVEAGYLSNAGQAQYLATDAGQREVAARIANGILRFLRS